MAKQLFTSMSDEKMASLVSGAKRTVAVACPSVRTLTAQALIRAHEMLGSDQVTIVVDCDDEVFRLGYGELPALEKLQTAGLVIRQSPGLRIGVLVCDDRAWVFSPTALYVQQEVHSDETPNAIELREADVQRILWRLVPGARHEPSVADLSEDLRGEATTCDVEVGIQPLQPETFEKTHKALELAPALPFDISRQVRVFEPYIQYVEISLLGAAIQRHRIEIPKNIQGLGVTGELEGRLRTTFDLIEKNSKISSKHLDDKLAEIRKNFTRSLGKPWGRVLLRATRPTFDKRIEKFRATLIEHQENVRKQLKETLDQSLENVIKYYLPLVKASPPDELIGQLMSQTPQDDDCRAWLDHELSHAFPDPEDLISEMQIEVIFRDVTYETLTEDGFGDALRKAYRHVDWDKPFKEFKAAKEREKQS